MPGIEPGASYMQSMRSTTELHPPLQLRGFDKPPISNNKSQNHLSQNQKVSFPKNIN